MTLLGNLDTHMTRRWFVMVKIGLLSVYSFGGYFDFFNVDVSGLKLRQILAILGGIVLYMVKFDKF